MTSSHSPQPPSNPERIDLIMRPFQRFAQLESSAGILLLLCTAIALLWSNSAWGESYTNLWQAKLTVGYGDFLLSKQLLLWINDGLMAIFFFVVGLEIKREILIGELASLKKSMLPVAAALGGMVAPALLYLIFNAGTEGAPGWGIPMATDIAFSLGVLALLGSRVPFPIKVFLTAFAIVDDIGAVLVIAFFYTADLAVDYLVWGAGFMALLMIANAAGVRRALVYGLLGTCLWFVFLKSGVHATIAGVLLAMTIPARTRINAHDFLDRARSVLDAFDRADDKPSETIDSDQQSAIDTLEEACEQIETPMQRFEHTLHPWVTFFIMPVFALANAGVVLEGDIGSALGHPTTLGIIIGLFFGKQIGVTLFAWLAVKVGWALLPTSVSWKQIYGVALLGGIGFTMSLFVAGLAFGEGVLLAASKVGILAASLLSGIVGYIVLRNMGTRAR